jgi:YVTN family beta-propeller protein
MRSETLRRLSAALLAAFATASLAAGPRAAAGPGATTNPESAAAATERSTAAPFRGAVSHEGIEVDVTIEPLDGANELREGDYARVRIAVTDGNTGTPLSALYPAAWMDRLPAGGDVEADPCRSKVEGFLGGSLLSQAEVDLNVFYVLALNEDASISVVDPLFGFGGSKLLAMIRLQSPGQDWAISENQDRLYVAMPEAGRVAVAETLGWEVLTNVDVGPGPRRLALQPDGAFLWVVFDGEESGRHRSGISVVGTTALKEITRIPTGAGAHDLAFSGDSRFAYVANAVAGTVTVIDVGRREAVAEVPTGTRPTSLAWSQAGRALYVTDSVDGTVVAIDGESHQVVARMQAEPGLGQIRFAPDGRYGLAVTPTGNSVFVVDAAVNRIVQHGEVEAGPDQVAFSDELAYVRHRDSETMLTIPLDAIGAEGKPIQVIDFPGGTNPPGAGDATPAAGMVQAPGAPAMLISNAFDGAIYFYKEGMAAPMGHFKNYGRAPRAVLVVDRSLQEVEPGVYQTGVRLRRPGDYDLALFLDTPRIVHCFPLEVAVDPNRPLEKRRKLMVRPLTDPATTLTVGSATELRFRALDPSTGDPVSGLADLTVLTVLAPGVWHDRRPAEEIGEGEYRLSFTPPRPGVYYVYAGSDAKDAGFNRNPYQALRAVEAVADAAAEGGAR